MTALPQSGRRSGRARRQAGGEILDRQRLAQEVRHRDSAQLPPDGSRGLTGDDDDPRRLVMLLQAPDDLWTTDAGQPEIR